MRRVFGLLRIASQLANRMTAPVEEMSDEESGDIPFKDASEDQADAKKSEDDSEQSDEDEEGV